MDTQKLDVEDKTRISGNTAEVLNDRYSLICMIGQGGMGSVYRGMNLSLQKPVAIKIVSANLVADPNVRARFDAEVRALSQLHHPNLISIIDVGVRADGCPFYVMEYIDGVPLDQVIKQEGAMPFSRAVPIFRQIAGALSYAHGLGIVHRDIKPSNIMLAQNDFAKIIDLGIAKVILQDNATVSKLTTTGEVFGSPVYMSPEQGSGKPIDARTDIYSLGCMMFEALTGRPPIVGQTPIETIFRHVTEIPPLVSSLLSDPDQPGVPLADEIVARCLEKDPTARYQSALALLDDLNHLESESAGLKSTRLAPPIKTAAVPGTSAATLPPQHATDQKTLSQRAASQSDTVVKPPNAVVQPANQQLSTIFKNKPFLLGMLVTLMIILPVLTYFIGASLNKEPQQHGVIYDGTGMLSGAHDLVSHNGTSGTFVSPISIVHSQRFQPALGKTPIYLVTTYKASSTGGADDDRFGDIDVDVNIENQPLILSLNSYQPVTWHVKPANERVRIVKVVACGYHPMKVIGVSSSVPVVRVWYRNFDAENRKTKTIAPDNQAEQMPQEFTGYWSMSLSTMNGRNISDLQQTAKALEAWSGGSLAGAESCYLGSRFNFPIHD